jgi:hypothetical protein
LPFGFCFEGGIVKKLALLLGVVAAGSANAALLWDNGPVVETGITNSSGNGVSVTAFHEPFRLGYEIGSASGNAIADDFTLGTAATVTSIRMFAFQNWSTPGQNSFNFSNVTLELATGGANGTVVQSTTQAAVNGGFVGYRTLVDLEERTRPIYAVDITGLNWNLGAGTYWVRFSTGIGTANSDFPYATLIADTPTNGNGMFRLNNGQFGPDNFVTTQPEFAFQVNGNAVPEPGTMIALGAGIAAIAARRRRK